MEQWQDQAIVLSVRPHGENGGIASLLTAHNGRHAGYVYGARSSKLRGTLEPGNLVFADWQSRTADNLGQYKLELERSHTASLIDDRRKLTALQSACALADKTLPEREIHTGVYGGMLALLDAFDTDVWGAAYIYWEICLLRELGFGLELDKCTVTGATDDLVYVSPRSGCAVSREAGAEYHDKMLALPGFLTGSGGFDDKAMADGLLLTGYFLHRRVFAPANIPMPEARERLFAWYESGNETGALQQQEA